MRKPLRCLPPLLSILLGACASMPSPRNPAVEGPPVTPAAEPAAKSVIDKPAPAPQADIWERLRGSFAMADCDADPAIMAWASRYTRNPKQFESQLQAALPRLAYVQQVADQYDVAGEFVLLPWVESHFHPAPTGKRHHSAGMWQLMPVTAGAMGLRVDGHYDGRLDIPAATHAVMKLLERYHDQFHDWRVADYAYNAGEFSVRRIIRSHGMPAERPVIPDWPVRKVTREHLTKLLAMACVVREPERFNVSLPSLTGEEHLVKMTISHSMPITQAADHAGMPADALKQINPAFRGNMIDAGAASYLLLPASHAQQFREAMPAQAGDASSGGKSPAGAQAAPRTHTVKRGDSLWQIARDYAVGVGQLQRWNRLQGQALKPGQVLQVSATN